MKKLLLLLLLLLTLPAASLVAVGQSAIDKYNAPTTPADYLPSNIRSQNSVFANHQLPNTTPQQQATPQQRAQQTNTAATNRMQPDATTAEAQQGLIDPRTHHRHQQEINRAYRRAFWTNVALNTVLWGTTGLIWCW